MFMELLWNIPLMVMEWSDIFTTFILFSLEKLFILFCKKVCAVRLNNGKAHFTSKYVGTDEYNAEKEMQKCLFRGMMGTMPEPDWEESLKKYLHSNESIRMKFKNPSNTNVYYWGGKVLACWESGLPYALDPITLKTLGKDTLGGALAEASCLAAHFRYDVKNNLLVTFSLRLSLSGNTKIYIHEFDENWRIVNQHKLSWENYYYAHDFLLTENYFIFHHSPFYNLKMENVAKIAMQQESPGKLMRYYPEIPSGMILVPRDKSKLNEQKFFECEPFHIYHHSLFPLFPPVPFSNSSLTILTVRFISKCI